MKTDYNGLVKLLRSRDEDKSLDNFEVYVGSINGQYDVEYSIEKKEVLDTIISDGDIDPSFSSRDVVNANYVCIIRYRNSENKSEGEVEKVFLFIENNSLKDFMFNLVEKDLDLYQKIFDRKNYKGNVSKYENSTSKGLKIVPSKELIKSNKGNAR